MALDSLQLLKEYTLTLTTDFTAKVMQSPGDCEYQHHSWVPDTKHKANKKINKSKG